MEKKLIATLKGGIIATTVMTAVMLAAPYMGMPKMPIGNMLAEFMHIPVALGWAAHFMIGTVLAGIYVYFFQERLPGNDIAKGALFSLLPFLATQTMVMPMMGAGIFSSNTPAPLLMVMGSLLGHLVYGGILGWVTKKEA